jgi:putative aldouronate transport system permease protein
MRDMFMNANLESSQITNRVVDINNRPAPHSVRMAITVLGVLPILCIYPFLQKYFTKGVYMGAVKE